MSGAELAVVLASAAVVVAVAVLGAIGVSLSRALKDLRRLLGEIRRELLPAVQRIEEASGKVTGEVQRVGGLLDVAERVSERAETLSRATSKALLEPLSAVASLFRRETPPEPPAAQAAGPAVTGWAGKAAAAPPRPARRAPWARRLTVYLLRTGFRSASARIAARLAAAQAQRAGTATGGPSSRPGTAGTPDNPSGSGGKDSRDDAPAGGRDATARGSAGSVLGRQALESIREVTREISEAMEEGRRALRADRGTGRRTD